MTRFGIAIAVISLGATLGLGCGSASAPDSCADDAQNGEETDVDCGGSVCGACDDGAACAIADDCASGNCADNTCVSASCGDGVVVAPEECDDAGESAACDVDCTTPSCGDGLANASAGEACDDGAESAACNANCTLAACGDGVFNASAGEECDAAGESDTCDTDCTAAVCGDGVFNATAGEACDDGAESPTCNANCTPAACGDGITNAAANEDCDDAGESAACDADCTVAVCGDGVLNTTAGEGCDDGNAVPGDGCAPDCTSECDPTREVNFLGRCFYLDGSAGTCEVGYTLAPQSVLNNIAPMFAGKTYKNIMSNNCCITHADQAAELQDWGMDGTDCNGPGPFIMGPTPGGAGCTDANQNNTQQLTLCQSI